MYIQKAIDLYNLRQEAANIAANREKHWNKFNLQTLGMLLLPDSSYHSVTVTMNRLKMGVSKSIKFDHVELICKTLGIDPNFLFGYESKFDREFKKLQNAA